MEQLHYHFLATQVLVWEISYFNEVGPDVDQTKIFMP